MWKSSRKLQQDCLAKTGCHLCIKTANMSPWKKIVAKNVALGDCKCSRVQDDYQRWLVADVNVKKVWKIKETLRWETGEIMMITAAMVTITGGSLCHRGQIAQCSCCLPHLRGSFSSKSSRFSPAYFFMPFYKDLLQLKLLTRRRLIQEQKTIFLFSRPMKSATEGINYQGETKLKWNLFSCLGNVLRSQKQHKWIF